MSKIGILGGTFDPIHYGHLNIAISALKELSLDKVLIVPTGNSYMKGNDVTDRLNRFKMAETAVKDIPGLEISDIEIKREGYTYTRDTLAELHELYPGSELFFIGGTDTLFSIEKWKDVSFIFDNCTLVIAGRKDSNFDMQSEHAAKLKTLYNAKIVFLNSEMIDVSSSVLRAHLSIRLFDEPVKNYINEEVLKFILDNDMYSDVNRYVGDLLRKELKESRIIHTFGVRDTALELGQIYGCDTSKVLAASLFHDCAKYVPGEEAVRICKDNGISLEPCEIANPEALLHSKVGAIFLKDKYLIDDEDIYNAVFYHTTGRPDMSMLEKIIFVSDYIEPGRNHSSLLPFYRELAKTDINKTIAYISKDTLQYLSSGTDESGVHQLTKETYEFYRQYE